MDTKSKTVEVLTDLLHVAKDGEDTFQQALAMADDGELESALRVGMRLCMIAAGQLEEMLRKLGDQPRARGSIPGAVRRAWMDARTTLSADRRDALLAEIVRAERAAVDHYEEAMAMPLGPEIHDRIVSQASGARANLHRFEELAATS